MTIASHARGDDIRVSRVERDATQRERDRSRAKRRRRLARALERSRRAMNKAQYVLTKRQAKRARRRAEAGLSPIDVVPMGPRIQRADGKPVQRYRRDQLSASYRRGCAAQAADAVATTQASRDRARQVAAEVVATHGYQVVVEDVSLAAWSRRWGRAVAAFTPGRLVEAIDREARAVSTLAGGRGGMARAATRTTALSQHCPCGERVPKRLADRVHCCPACGLRADRDAVSATLASFITFAEPGVPSSAHVDYDAIGHALPAVRAALSISARGWQDTRSESNGVFPSGAREGSFLAWSTPTPDAVVVARRIVGTAPRPTLDETGFNQTTSERPRMRPNMSSRYDLRSYLRDNS